MRDAVVTTCVIIVALSSVGTFFLLIWMSAKVKNLSEGVNLTADLGFHNAETAERIEEAAAHVAHDLADAMDRADALPADSQTGAAADAASRSGHPTEES